MADKLHGSAIVANTISGDKFISGSITSAQLEPTLANAITTPLHPKISSIVYPAGSIVANTGGGETIVFRGSGFQNNVQVYINGTSTPSVVRNNANAVTITTAAQSAGTYLVYIINTDDGGTAILVPGIQYSGTPTWVTASPLTTQETVIWNIPLSATGDSPITYSLQSGSSLPAGITLSANGLISGTMTSPPSDDTTYNFTVIATDPQQQNSPKAFSVTVTLAVDPNFQYTTLLLQADGNNTGNNHTFLDLSNNNFTISRSGNTSQGSFSPFTPTAWSNYFDGDADYLNLTNNSAFLFGSGDFTIEFWTYMELAGIFAAIWDDYSTAPQAWALYGDTYGSSATQLRLLVDVAGSDTVILTSGPNIPINRWTHIAVTRSGSNWYMFFDGIIVGTASSSVTISNGSGPLGIGGYSGSNQSHKWSPKAYISNFRILKGTALYTANFTPPTTPLTAIANTSLLTCQSNRFYDSSNNNFTITRNGNTSIQTFSPIGTTTAYSPVIHGGSAYFDGSGDYLSVADSTALDLNTTFTVEAWFYQSTAGDGAIFCRGGGSASWSLTNGHEYNLVIVSGTLYWQFNSGGSPISLSVTAPAAGAWHHVAVGYNGTTTRFWLDGISVGTSTNSYSLPSTRNITRIGYTASNEAIFTGYISSLRVVKGTDVYGVGNTNITVPTAPPAAIANTSFLCNFNNAQIYDSDGGIVFETIGDAKVNTSIKKYGTGSISFDGTGDYLRSPYNVDLQMGTGDFTLEAWIYLASAPSDYGLIFNTRNSSAQYSPLQVYVRSTRIIDCYFSTNGSTNSNLASTGTVPLTTWTHVAVVRASGVVKIYLNGNAEGTSLSLTGSLYLDATWGSNIGGESDGNSFNGYIDDLRITKGLARYLYNFTPPSKILPSKNGTIAVTSDENFDYTTLLLSGNGANNQNNHTFVDSSTNNFTLTRSGNTTQGSFSPFSQTGWSNYFDGSGDYLSIADNVALDLGTGDFTIEGWVYIDPSAVDNDGIIGKRNQSSFNAGDWRIAFNQTDDKINIACGAENVLRSTPVVGFNQWVHFAFVRSGTTLSCYANGILGDQDATWGHNLDNAETLLIGINAAGLDFLGYISNIRIVKGTAVYTSAFTPPTSPLTAITNTSLLTCQSNRFIDNSTNNLTITPNGDVSVQAFSPFNPTAAWSAATNGGSGYFDGSGDYLDVTNNNTFDTNSTFTLECWVLNFASTTQAIFARGGGNAGSYWNTSDGTQFILYFGGSNTINWQWNNAGSPATINATAPAKNQWTHIAVGYNGTTTRVWVDGVSIGTSTTAYTLPTTRNVVRVGAEAITGATSPFNGYISGLRFVKGTDVYGVGNTSITVPTAPLTAITNTSILLNFTNAGIHDATSKNDLETVGNAQISTTQSKWGGSSMYFDGAGDYLFSPSRATTALEGDFTVEFWVYRVAGNNRLFTLGDSYYSNGFDIYIGNSGANLRLYSASVVIDIALSGIPFPASAWNHFALVRYGGVVKIYVNGINVGSSWSSTTAFSGSVYVGAEFYNGSITGTFNGYMQDFRITKGIARYTQNFTLPTTAFLTR